MVEENEVQEWIGQLQSDDMNEQREASRLLGSAGRPAVAPMIEALASSTDSDQRWYLAVALARVGRPALEPLIAALPERRDPGFRRYAAAALAEMGEDAVEPLVGLLGLEGDTGLRGVAAQALVRIGEPAIERLREAVEAGGTLGAVAGFVLLQMEEPGVRALVGLCCPEDEVRPAKEGGSAEPCP